MRASSCKHLWEPMKSLVKRPHCNICVTTASRADKSQHMSVCMPKHVSYVQAPYPKWQHVQLQYWLKATCCTSYLYITLTRTSLLLALCILYPRCSGMNVHFTGKQGPDHSQVVVLSGTMEGRQSLHHDALSRA